MDGKGKKAREGRTCRERGVFFQTRKGASQREIGGDTKKKKGGYKEERLTISELKSRKRVEASLF